MAQFSEKQVILIIALSGLVLSGGAWGGVYWAQGKAEEERLVIDGLDKKITEAEAKKARIPVDEKDVIILRENVSEYVKILPETSELTNFARTITRFAMQSGVVISSLSPKLGGRGAQAFSNYSYSMAFTGTLWQFMKFMNSFESFKRFVDVTTFTITAGQPDDDDNLDDVVHRYTMEVNTYVYNQAAGGKKAVQIPNYEIKREWLREDIYRARTKIQVEKYAFKGGSARRDIFVDPRLDTTTTSGGVIDVPEQAKFIDELAEEIKVLQKIYTDALILTNVIERYEKIREVKRRLKAVRVRVDDITDKDIISYRPYRLKFQREVTVLLDELWMTVFTDKEASGEEIPLSLLMSTRRFMEDSLIDGRLEDAVERFQIIRERLFFQETQVEKIKESEHLRILFQKASSALEFSRLNLKLTGHIVTDGGISTAIINSKTYQEGDALSADLFLLEIGPEWLKFLYKGVEILRKQQ